MKNRICIAVTVITFLSCNLAPDTEKKENESSVQGTWKLLTGTLITGKDTVVTDYTNGKSFIKIINQTHFSFIGHDLNKGNDSAAFYSSGGGKYELADSNYTEHLEYCNDRGWEGSDFHFTIAQREDTLIIQGIEKIDSLDINRINIEKYIKLNN